VHPALQIGSAAAAGLARLFSNYCTFLANRAGFQAAEPLPVPRTLRDPMEPIGGRGFQRAIAG